MPSYIVQPVQGEDFHVVWSEVVDGPTFTGTAEELHAHMRDRALEQFEHDHAESMKRVSQTSCSASWLGGWDVDEEFQATPSGSVIRRSRLRAYCEALGPCGEQTDASRALLTITDPEEFCTRCFAGVDSSEHHEKCVVTGHAKDGESA